MRQVAIVPDKNSDRIGIKSGTGVKEEKIVMKTKLIRICFLIAGSLLLMSGLAMVQPEQTTAGNPPLEQPLIREGDLAVKLVEALKLGTPESEAEAESILASVDITPRNGWIADYPVTPDIVDELQSAVGEAAESGKIAVAREAALERFRDVLNEDNLSVKADTSGTGSGETTGPNYPDSTGENNYYYDEGPPVVTYYSPPPDYAYLYTWVPYPFWWTDVWFPGFFILGDFDVDVDRHRHGHHHDHGKRISNHFADPKTSRIFRVDPAGRFHGGTVSDRAGAGARPSAESGGRAILNTGRGRAATGTYREFRGYGASGPPAGTPSSAFDRSSNSQFERNSSDRGFQSRSNAGLTPGAGSGSAGGPRGGGGTVSHGGGSGSGGAGFHGGGGGGGMRR
jgi:hypothetical protein